MNIEIPKKTPLGRDITTIGVWMSGGADSSLLCFLLAEKIVNEKLPIKIQPLTIDYKRPFANIAVSVRLMIEKLLDAEHVFEKHIVYNPPENVTWSTEEYEEHFHIRNYENFKNNKFQVLYSGITTNPPREVQQNFNWGVLENVEQKRGPNAEKATIRYFERDGGEFIEYKPFFKLDKKMLAEVYKDKKLLSTLFPLTRSCEDEATVRGHCGNCWWCEERYWGFGTL